MTDNVFLEMPKEWQDLLTMNNKISKDLVKVRKLLGIILEELNAYRAIGTVEEVKNAYGRGYNQGSIDRAEELQKCREYGYNKAIDEFAEVLKEKNKTLIIGNRMIDEIAEQLKGVQE